MDKVRKEEKGEELEEEWGGRGTGEEEEQGEGLEEEWGEEPTLSSSKRSVKCRMWANWRASACFCSSCCVTDESLLVKTSRRRRRLDSGRSQGNGGETADGHMISRR